MGYDVSVLRELARTARDNGSCLRVSADVHGRVVTGVVVGIGSGLGIRDETTGTLVEDVRPDQVGWVSTAPREGNSEPPVTTEDGADRDYLAWLAENTNNRNTSNGWWYVEEVPTSPTARRDGKLRRVVLWLLTDSAARAAELID